MDLAEIRKKAKMTEPLVSRKEVRANAAKAPTHEPTGQESVVEAPEKDAKLLDETSALLDPLEALFNHPLEIVAATEEGYQQGLERSTEEAGNLRQLLTFLIGDEEYALDIETIREIIKPREVTDLPRVPGFILGIISLRGIIIPIYDLKQRLRLGTSALTASSRIVVCQQADRVVGLLVDSISQVMRIPLRNIEPPPAVLSGIDRDLIEGVGRYQGKMMILLHLPCVADVELV